jgi:hypothetical protein
MSASRPLGKPSVPASATHSGSKAATQTRASTGTCGASAAGASASGALTPPLGPGACQGRFRGTSIHQGPVFCEGPCTCTDASLLYEILQRMGWSGAGTRFLLHCHQVQAVEWFLQSPKHFMLSWGMGAGTRWLHVVGKDGAKSGRSMCGWMDVGCVCVHVGALGGLLALVDSHTSSLPLSQFTGSSAGSHTTPPPLCVGRAGKTYGGIACALAHTAHWVASGRGPAAGTPTILIVCPAKLIPMWLEALGKVGVPCTTASSARQRTKVCVDVGDEAGRWCWGVWVSSR